MPSPVGGSVPSLRHVTVKFQNVSTETGPGSSQEDENRRHANQESELLPLNSSIGILRRAVLSRVCRKIFNLKFCTSQN